jgi:hypothetical protein
VARGLLQDVSLTLLRILPNDAAQLRITFTPLGAWLWPGLALLLAAGVTAWAVALRRGLTFDAFQAAPGDRQRHEDSR